MGKFETEESLCGKEVVTSSRKKPFIIEKTKSFIIKELLQIHTHMNIYICMHT